MPLFELILTLVLPCKYFGITLFLNLHINWNLKHLYAQYYNNVMTLYNGLTAFLLLHWNILP